MGFLWRKFFTYEKNFPEIQARNELGNPERCEEFV
jgi:hypothetical protein